MALNGKRLSALGDFEKGIGYSFKNTEILNQALTHSSYFNSKEVHMPHYERLEFVGDSILGFIIGLYLFKNDKNIDEGKLTRVRANIVCEQSLYKIALQLNIGKYILMSRGEELTGGRNRISILADIVEAIIAAIYLDSGIDNATNFVLTHFNEVIDDAINDRIFNDYKSYLQEYMQKISAGDITYNLLTEEGPDHDKTFEMIVCLSEKVIGQGTGKSKKDAQQSAAQNAIEKLGIKDE